MAKKFNFRLESVLKLREHTANTEMTALMGILNERYKKEEEITAHENYYSSLLKETKGKQTVADIQAGIHHRDSIKSEIKKLNNDKKQLIEIENIQRNKFNEAKKDEKVIIKLKDRKRTAYNEEVNKEEGKVLDEIAGRRHGGWGM